MLLFLLFASVAAQCETGTCGVCKNITGCDWYGWDCYNKTSSAVTTLKLTASASCDVCQAGNCTDCTEQSGCSWFKNNIPGAPGKCATTGSAPALYTELTSCPACNNYMSCATCSNANETCGWYTLAGTSGRCREAAPTFAWSKVKLGYCDGDPCANKKSCNKCQETRANNDNTTAICAWYQSKFPQFYDSKCDSIEGAGVSSAFYTNTTTCPDCAGTSCIECKDDAKCKWVAMDAGVLGTSFGQCLLSTTATPTGKSVIATCPAVCDLHSCSQCQAQSACSWYTGSPVGVDDSCDLAKDAALHSVSGQSAATTCPACGADRCYECNNLAGCGWYAKTIASKILFEGCYLKTSSTAADRTLIANTDKRCEGVPGSSAHVAASMVIVAVLALVA